MIELENKNIRIFESSYIRLSKPFDSFDIDLFEMSVTEESDKDDFLLKYGYSVDGKNYTNHVEKENFKIDDLYSGLPLYFSVFVERVVYKDLNKPSTLYHKFNIVDKQQMFEISSLKYDGKDIDFLDDEFVKLIKIGDLINQFPKWNLYDNQYVTINRWVRQCNAIAEMYGHTCIYFKTDPSATIHTLKNHYNREVTEIKKLHILFPNNDIGSVDRVVYSDWDMPLQDDFIAHIVVDKFFQAFGENQIPNEKDFLYIPFLNKMFSVGIVQPVNKFMGKIAWWEVNLLKYEDDETVVMSQQLKESIENIPEFEKALDLLTHGELLNIYGLDYIEEPSGKGSVAGQEYDSNRSDAIGQEGGYDTIGQADEYNLIDQIDSYKEDTTNSMERIWEDTTDEKKEVTEGYTNKLVDSTWYVSMKETEKIREYYHKRLQIITVETDKSLYPLQMYDYRNIETNVVAMQYRLSDYTEKSKNDIDGNILEFSFDFVSMDKFNGSVLDVLDINGSFTCIELQYNRFNKITFVFGSNGQDPIEIDYKFVNKEIYQICFEINKEINQLSVKIFGLVNKEKSLLYENIYSVDLSTTELIGYIQLFGGKYLLGSLELKSDNKNIMKDYCNPLLIMNKITAS